MLSAKMNFGKKPKSSKHKMTHQAPGILIFYAWCTLFFGCCSAFLCQWRTNVRTTRVKIMTTHSAGTQWFKNDPNTLLGLSEFSLKGSLSESIFNPSSRCLKNKFNTRQGLVSPMIHSARPTVSPVANIVLFCQILKSGDGRTYGLTEGRTTCSKTIIHTGRDCGAAEWVNKFFFSEIMWPLSYQPGPGRTLNGHYVNAWCPYVRVRPSKTKTCYNTDNNRSQQKKTLHGAYWVTKFSRLVNIVLDNIIHF